MSEPTAHTKPARGIPAADLRAFRFFCESVYQGTNARLDAVLSHDWSNFGRIAEVLEALPRPVSQEALAKTAAGLLREAVDDLAPSFPTREGHVTPLEIFELHVLERQPWPSILALLEEQGRPHARGTLIRRQHELLPYLLEWARMSDEDVVGVPIPSRHRPRRTPLLVAATVLFVLVGTVTLFRIWPGRSESIATEKGPLVATELRGVRIEASLESGGTLPGPWPPLPLPDLKGRHLVAMVLEDTPGDPEIVLGYQLPGDPAAQICRWNPGRAEMVWSTRFDPPPEERLTHDGVGAEVLDQTHQIANMFHAGPEGDLGRHAALNVIQKFSPTFVIFLDLATGSVDGYYVHPGHINAGLVVDVDQDGRCELVLAGQDNSLNRAAAVALRPFTGRGAASTVKWNETGREHALCRVLLPVWPEAEAAIGTKRLSIARLGPSDFDASSRIFSLSVESMGRPVYHVRLGPGLLPDDRAPFVLWDADEITIDQLGIEPPDFRAWVDQIEVIEGTGGT